LTFTRGSQHLEIAANVISPADMRLRYENEFKLADADGNGYLDRSEAARRQQLGSLFNVLDADGDGQVFRRELLTFGDQQMEFARTRVTLMAVERGRDLFQVLDANGDQRLGERELKAGADLVTRWDANGDQRLSYAELPSQVMLAVELGPPTAVRQIPPPPQAGSVTVLPAAGPLWLQRMDKNRDGEVSRREFLGPASRFTALDANRDGAIDAEEAAGTLMEAHPGTLEGTRSF
jgi:hypothetical protein